MLYTKYVNDLAFDVFNEINKDLSRTNLLNLNSLLLRFSNFLSKDLSISNDEKINYILLEVNKILIKYSFTFKEIFDCKDYSNVYLFLINYMKSVLKYYDNLMNFNRDKFDRYVEITNGRMPKKKVLFDEDIYISIDDIQNTMNLLNEAVRNYYEIYYNKSLYTIFSDESVITFKIKESELSHLLGVSLRKIVNDPKYVDLFHISSSEVEALNDMTFTLDPNGSAAVSILHKIIDVQNGDLFQFELDRLKKIKNYRYKSFDFSDEDKNLLWYSKINIRSKAFIDYKPLENLSLALSFPIGYNIIKSSKDNSLLQQSLLISKNSLSDQFRYSSLISNYDYNSNRRYFLSLFLERPDEFAQLQKDGVPSISTQVILSSDADGGSVIKEFSISEQVEFFESVVNDFKYIDLTELYEYFYNLNNNFRKSI